MPYVMVPVPEEHVEEAMQAVLRIANAHKTPVWTSGQGRNNGYGGAAPRVSGSFALSLRRMNRVRAVDPDACIAVAEAGVILSHLHDAAHAAGRRAAQTRAPFLLFSHKSYRTQLDAE